MCCKLKCIIAIVVDWVVAKNRRRLEILVNNYIYTMEINVLTFVISENIDHRPIAIISFLFAPKHRTMKTYVYDKTVSISKCKITAL